MPTLEEIPYQNDKNTKWTILPFDEEYKFNFEYYDYLSNIKQDLLKNIPELYFVPETHMNDLTYEYVEKNKFNIIKKLQGYKFKNKKYRYIGTYTPCYLK
jgi:superfamily I DNA and/or RNA helicase